MAAQGAALLEAGRYAEAAPVLRQALQKSPRDPEILHDLGVALLNLQDFPQSLRCFERALAIWPNFGPAHFRRGIVLEILRQPGAAQAYEAALANGFENAGVLSRLASLWEGTGRRGPAAELYRRAAALAPGTLLAALNTAQAALIEGELEEAEAALRRVLAENPAAGSARGQLAQITAARGDFPTASAGLEQALRDAPQEIGLYFDLVQLGPVTAADTALLARLHAAQTIDAPLRARIRAALALAKAQRDLGDHAAALAALRAADELRRRTSIFEPASLATQTAQITALFTPAYLARADHQGDPSDLPVFVLGLPRSGTTLVEQIIASHPQAAGAGEVHFWEAEGQKFLPTARPDQPADLRQAAATYLKLLAKAAPTAARVVDKMPFNFRWAALIHLALPNARIIHVRRNLADTALSIMANDLSPSRSFSAAKPDLLAFAQDYLHTMAHLRAVLPPARFLEISYEQLVADPEPHIRALLSFIGLPWDAACLAPERSGQTVRTASVWQVRQPIHSGSAGSRRDYAGWVGEFEAK
jgi:tetratricopeptide (TPR) repeat protein